MDAEATKQDWCPPCDYPAQAVHFKAELERLSENDETVRAHLESMQNGFEILIRSEHSHVDDIVREIVRDTSEQIRQLTKIVEATSEAQRSNVIELGKVKTIMAKSMVKWVAIWSSAAAAVVAIVPELIRALKS
jgi:phage host-nuclease inhibitor protein Gam